MARIAAFLIFWVLVAIVYLVMEAILPQWIDLNSMYNTISVRFDSERAVAIFVLSLYLLLALSVLISFGRWMARFAMDIVTSIQNFFSGKKDAPEHQTLDNTLIIDSPKLKKPVVRFLETVFSAAVWLFFVYLFQTIITTLLWILGMDGMYNFNFSEASIEGTIGAVLTAFYAAVLSIIVLYLWAKWNYWRFGRLDRRQPAPHVTASEVATFFSLPLATIMQIQSTKMMAIMPVADGGLVFREIES